MIEAKNEYLWFSEIYDTIYKDLVDYRSDVNFILKQYKANTGFEIPTRVLDLGCGTGSHLLEFSKRGIATIGLDTSLNALEIARLKLNGFGKFKYGDIRSLDVGHDIDLSISMFSTLGYLLSNEDLIRTLTHLKYSLNNYGLFICELWQSNIIATGIVTEIQAKGKIGTIKRTSRFTVLENNVLSIIFDFEITNTLGKSLFFSENHLIRTFSQSQIIEYFSIAGFDIIEMFQGGSFQKIERTEIKASDEDFRIIVLSKQK